MYFVRNVSSNLSRNVKVLLFQAYTSSEMFYTSHEFTHCLQIFLQIFFLYVDFSSSSLSHCQVYFYNFGWKDYGVASLTTILDMVKVMTFALQEGKVAVHCHAGLGRTGKCSEVVVLLSFGVYIYIKF